MKSSDQLTLGEVAERVARSGGKLVVHAEHGSYHAYMHSTTKRGQGNVGAYERGDLAEVIDQVTRAADPG